MREAFPADERRCGRISPAPLGRQDPKRSRPERGLTGHGGCQCHPPTGARSTSRSRLIMRGYLKTLLLAALVLLTGSCDRSGPTDVDAAGMSKVSVFLGDAPG